MQRGASLAGPEPAAAVERRTPAFAGPTVILAVAGACLVLLYLVATVRLWLPRYFPGPGVSIGFPQILGEQDWRRTAIQYVGLVVLAFAFYSVALVAVWRSRRPVPAAVLFGGPVVFVLVLAWMYPAAAMDIFHYQASARVFWVHDDNPLTVPPSAHPYAIGISWADRPSVYGPVWSLLTVGPTLLAGDRYLVGVVGFKLLAGLFYLGCAWLIWRLVARTRPGWETVAVVLFAWNPFVVLRSAGHGHNDIVMMFFVLLALERTQRRDWLAAFPSLALAVLVKYVAALLGPMLLWYAWEHTPGTARERLRTLLPALSAAAGMAVLMYLPFWEGRATFKELVDQARTMIITSTPLLVQTRLQSLMPIEEAGQRARTLTQLIFLALYVPLVWQARRDFTRLVACSTNALFLYIVIAVAWFRPWYMIWPLAVAALLPGTWFAPLLLVISFSASFPDLVEHYRYNWEWLRDYWRATAAPVMVAFWPPLLAWYFGLLAFRSWHFDAPRRTRPTPTEDPT
jgi:alpha-1,6-mannosyltransferase